MALRRCSKSLTASCALLSRAHSARSSVSLMTRSRSRLYSSDDAIPPRAYHPRPSCCVVACEATMSRVLDWLVAGGIGALAGYSLVPRRRRPRAWSRREKHFLTPSSGSMIGISTNLLQSSRLLLQASLDERRGGVWRSKENHATWYAPGVVVMIATALDAWLTELLASGRLHLDISAVYSKYERAAELLFGTRIRASTDLEYVSKVRNEVVHFLPYTQDITKRTVPDWLQYLDGHDL